jgi:Lon protease-like protein
MLPDDLDLDGTQVTPEEIPEELAVLPVSDAVIFPHMLVPLVISDRKLIMLAEDVLEGNKLFGAFTQRPPEQDEDDEEARCAFWARGSVAPRSRRSTRVSRTLQHGCVARWTAVDAANASAH